MSNLFRSLSIGLFILFLAVFSLAGRSSSKPIPAPIEDSRSKGEQTAVFAGGCFWGVEGVFRHVKGVSHVVSGFSGGNVATAHYEIVSAGGTEQAESVKLNYDPAQISYGQLLQIFFSVVHDPTQLDRQGPDFGHQYRSVIFYTTPEQAKVARAYIAQLNRAKVFAGGPIVTQVVPLKAFYRAEDYHQNFLANHPDNPYIVVHDLPKLQALKQQFPNLYRP
jgi:peptide-methionine (S)-S-oxide reductase